MFSEKKTQDQEQEYPTREEILRRSAEVRERWTEKDYASRLGLKSVEPYSVPSINIDDITLY